MKSDELEWVFPHTSLIIYSVGVAQKFYRGLKGAAKKLALSVLQAKNGWELLPQCINPKKIEQYALFELNFFIGFNFFMNCSVIVSFSHLKSTAQTSD